MDLKLVQSSALHRVYSCVFEKDEPCFHDHFPDCPVVPGSLLMAVAVTLARQLQEECATLPVIEKFSFRHFLTPGTYTLLLRNNADRVLCEYRSETTVYAKGILVWN